MRRYSQDEDGECGYCGWYLKDDMINMGQERFGLIAYEDDPMPTHWAPIPMLKAREERE